MGRFSNIKNTSWNDNEERILKENYHSLSITQLCKLLNKSAGVISYKIKLLKLRGKVNKRTKISDVSFLLDEDLSNYYWMGYILADGTFNHKTSSLSIKCAEKDSSHLKIFADKAAAKIHKYHTKSGYKPVDFFTVSCGDENIIPKIIEKFQIKRNKTYNPPKFNEYNFSEDKILSMIIGFIDGDGCILVNKEKSIYRIQIQSHISWLDNLNYIKKKLYSLCDKPFKEISNKNKYPVLGIGGINILKKLKIFAIQNNLPILERKWNKIDDIDIN